MRLGTFFLTVTLALWLPQAHANGDEMAEVYKLYKQGGYSQAIELLNKMDVEAKDKALIAYWQGLCHSRLQQFDEAAKDFDEAIRLKAPFDDLDYERGQALYASQKLRPARDSFLASIHRKFKIQVSKYYVGYISQLLEDYPQALKAYNEIATFPNDDEQVKQAAMLQIGEVRLALVKSKLKDKQAQNTKVRSWVVPSFRAARDLASETDLGKQAGSRLGELEREYGTVERFTNGVPMPQQPWFAKISEDLKYDDNVIVQADNTLMAVTQKDSGIAATDIFGKYEFTYNNEYAFVPEIDVNYLHYTNGEEPQVYQNETVSSTAALRMRREHTLWGGAAATLFDIEGNYMLRDWRAVHEPDYYSQYQNFIFGERAKILPWGSTTLTINSRFYQNQDPTQNALDPGMSLSQNFKLTDRLNLTETFTYDYSWAKAAYNSRTNYHLVSVLVAPELFYKFDLTASLDLGVIDTMQQRPGRGYEKFINPSLSLRRFFSPHLYMTSMVSYTKNISLDTVYYQYTKWVASVGMGYQF